MPKSRKKRKFSWKMTKASWQALAAIGAALVLILVVVLLSLPREAELPPEPTLPPPEANPYGPQDFAFEGDYLTCTTADSRLGVDVSEHQEAIDWAAVSQAGVEFAIIRLGYRGYSEGGLYTDIRALENLRGAREAGLDVGAYFYSQAVTPEEAREEAALALEILDGMALELPLVYDWEYVSSDARTGSLSGEALTECTLAFCQAVEAGGYEAMVYFNQDLSANMFQLSRLTDYGFWLAMYDTEMTYPYRVKLWQYTCTGTVPGIPGEVDLNLLLP